MIGATRFHSTLRGTRPGVDLYARMGILTPPLRLTGYTRNREFFADSLQPFRTWGLRLSRCCRRHSGAPTTHDPTRTFSDPCPNSALVRSIRRRARLTKDGLKVPRTCAARAVSN